MAHVSFRSMCCTGMLVSTVNSVIELTWETYRSIREYRSVEWLEGKTEKRVRDTLDPIRASHVHS